MPVTYGFQLEHFYTLVFNNRITFLTYYWFFRIDEFIQIENLKWLIFLKGGV